VQLKILSRQGDRNLCFVGVSNLQRGGKVHFSRKNQRGKTIFWGEKRPNQRGSTSVLGQRKESETKKKNWENSLTMVVGYTKRVYTIKGVKGA